MSESDLGSRPRSPPGVKSPDRRTVLHGLAGVAVAPFVRPPARSSPPAFLAIGDWGEQGGHHQRAVAAAMGVAASEIDSRFVLSAGDNFYPAGVRSVNDPQWKSSFEDIYTAASLQTPWFVALGNHDYRGLPRAQLAYSHVSPRWRMPSRYFKLGPADTGIAQLDIFVIDTAPLIKSRHEATEQLMRGHLSTHPRPGAQLRWLRQELESSTAAWKIVVGHHPIYSGGAHRDTPKLVAQVQPLLEAHGVQAYINGHDHDLQHIRRGSTNYICSGAGARARRVQAVEGTQFCLSRPGFAMFTLDSDALWLEFRDLHGQQVYRASIASGGASAQA